MGKPYSLDLRERVVAALEWCEAAPHGQQFLTTDERLREAAEITGFEVKPI